MDDMRLPPQNLDAERSVLGCQLMLPEIIDDVAEVMLASDLYSDVHQEIQRAIEFVHQNGGAVDVLTVADRLERKQKLGEVGGALYLSEILESVPHGHNAVHYATIVAECSRRRKAIDIGHKLIEDAYRTDKDETEIASATVKSAMAFAEIVENTNNRKPRYLHDHVGELIKVLDHGEELSVFWGIEEIDRMINGAAPGNMVVIAGAPSNGKSVLAVQWLMEASRFVPGLLISEEMRAPEIAQRTLMGYVNFHRSDWNQNAQHLRDASTEHFKGRHKIVVAEKCGSIAALERQVSLAVQRDNVKIVAIDYAQLVRGVGDGAEERLANVSHTAKSLASKYGLIVLLVSQLNREILKRENPIPKLSDLRGSGALEADADKVLFIVRPWMLDKDYEPRDEVRIHLAKDRNEGIREDVVVMRINEQRQRLEPVPHEHGDFM